jgi:hypothetical protein
LELLLVAIVGVVRLVVIILERLTDAPIMRQRINRGSDEFFAWEAEHRGETELDEVLDPRELRG